MGRQGAWVQWLVRWVGTEVDARGVGNDEPTSVLQYSASGMGTVPGNSLEMIAWMTEYGSPMCCWAITEISAMSASGIDG